MWVFCNDRLPDIGQEVLVVWCGSIYTAVFDGTYWNFEDFDVSIDEDIKVIAWQPLPELPIMEECEDGEFEE